MPYDERDIYKILYHSVDAVSGVLGEAGLPIDGMIIIAHGPGCTFVAGGSPSDKPVPSDVQKLQLAARMLRAMAAWAVEVGIDPADVVADVRVDGKKHGKA